MFSIINEVCYDDMSTSNQKGKIKAGRKRFFFPACLSVWNKCIQIL